MTAGLSLPYNNRIERIVNEMHRDIKNIKDKRGARERRIVLCLWVVIPMVFGGGLVGCIHNKPSVGLFQATEDSVDVFTCKGLTEEGHWIGITDQFLPEEDPYVIVAAQLNPEHRKSRVTFELTSPADYVVMNESKQYPENLDLGVQFDMNRLLERGGEGKWTAAVYADGEPIGKAVFTIGKKEEEEEEAARYEVIGMETEETESSAEAKVEPATKTVTPTAGATVEDATKEIKN